MTSLSATGFGLTATGFVPKTQAQIIAEISTALQTSLGAQVNLGAESVLGQLTGIFSEREALVWAVLEALYASQYPSGAEGLAVDNVLSLSGLQRLQATASVTDPAPAAQSNGISLYGLLLYGTAGTVVPQGALVRTASTPVQSFALNAQVTIQSAVNAQQSLVFSNIPTSGTFQLTFTEKNGTKLTTNSVAYTALLVSPKTMQLGWTAAPTGGSYQLMLGSVLAASVPYNVSAATLQSTLIAALDSSYAGLTVTGSYTAGYQITFPTGVFAHSVRVSSAIVAFASAPTSGTFTLAINGIPIAALPYNCTAQQLRAAVNAAGFPLAQVAFVSPSFYINWVSGAAATVTVAASTTSPAPTIGSTNQLVGTGSLASVQCLQYYLSSFTDIATGVRPFTDVGVTGSNTTYAITFGATAGLAGQPSSGAQPQPLITVAQNSLFAGTTFVNVSPAIATQGAPSQGVGQATCTTTGPVTAPAGTLTVIGSPQTGLAGVTNQLDVIPGQNVESDTDALIRRSNLLGKNANGPLGSIVQQVSQVKNVASVVGFQNLTEAAVQLVWFSTTPTTGAFSLLLANGSTAAIAYNASAAQVQAAINAVNGYASALVYGSAMFGFQVDFNGSLGGQTQPLIQVGSNTTGVTLNITWGRPPKSFELVVEGGADIDIAKTIYAASPAGIVSYGTPAASTTGSPVTGSATLVVASSTGIVSGQSVYGIGIPNGTMVLSVSGTSLTLSQAAIGSASNVAMTFNSSVQLSDSAGNPVLVAFSRPVPVLIYVAINLITDTYRVPGQASSGVNAASKFSPSSIPRIQQEIADIGNATATGGIVIGQGTSGLVGAFNDVPGILGFTLTFGTAPSPTNTANIQLLPTQAASFQVANVVTTWT